MKTLHPFASVGKALAAAATGSVFLAGCASMPIAPPDSQAPADVRARLTRLQSDPNLGSRAPVAVQEAEAAVQIAEQPVPGDAQLGIRRVYLADRQIKIAIAEASTHYAKDQRERLSEERAAARLDARTSQDALQAEVTDRGLTLRLGDVAFASDAINLQTGVTDSLDRLVVFLNKYSQRSVRIEGHTDSVGSEDYNQALSQHRAQSVKAYLVRQGIGSQRLVASGLGESQPIADNGSRGGRQHNRRVEVIIDNPLSLPESM